MLEGGEELQKPVNGQEISGKSFSAREDLQEKTILVTAHGCIVRALLQNVYRDTSLKNFWHGRDLPNCCVNIVEIKRKQGYTSS